ncbi:gephyrin-like molybdotransferase Glp [Microbacterium sp. WCS2018Hpa-23]|uniref:molybdopterin molybdotransferase MoeA n=1 Tax=Microbacterium sp. WCS2018Hpa-23 TaxID=3073634 RepID=UPI0028835609|nr:gephyrin-like molybdotransferase Glp [Microbacterium sp. WCS2018Hpa-23]
MVSTPGVDDYLESVLRSVPLLPAERVELDAAQGRTLQEPVHAATSLPAFDNSAMDGFAVRFADLAVASRSGIPSLRVVADLPAGTDEDPTLPSRTAARIMTGAPIPTDADTVIPFEDTADGLTDSLTTTSITRLPPASGAHVRRLGDDAQRGDEIVTAGTVLGSLQIAAIAAVGVDSVLVTRALRVAVISTGSELVEPGVPLRRGQIPESNSRMLAALAVEAGCTVVRRASIPDEPARLIELLAEVTAPSSSQCADVVLFSGGVSAGAFEVVKLALAAEMTFTHVAMRPGRPQGFGVSRVGTVLFGLPGNPVSAAVSFEAFVRPALMQMQGRLDVHRPSLLLPAASGWRSPAGRRHYVPVSIDRSDPAGWVAVPVGPGGSHRASTLGRSDGYAVTPEDAHEVRPGDRVRVMLTS